MLPNLNEWDPLKWLTLSANSKMLSVNRRGVSMKTPSDVGMDGLVMSQMLARFRPCRTDNCETGTSLRYTASKLPNVRFTPARASLIQLDDTTLVNANWKNWFARAWWFRKCRVVRA